MLFPTFLYLLFAVTTFANPVSGPKKVLEKRSDAKGCDCPRMNGDCFIWAQFLVYPNGETSTKIPVCTSASDNTLRYVCQNTFDEPNCNICPQSKKYNSVGIIPTPNGGSNGPKWPENPENLLCSGTKVCAVKTEGELKLVSPTIDVPDFLASYDPPTAQPRPSMVVPICEKS